LNDTRDGVTQSLPNPLSRPPALSFGIEVRGRVSFDGHIGLGSAVKDIADFFRNGLPPVARLNAQFRPTRRVWTRAQLRAGQAMGGGTPCHTSITPAVTPSDGG
jgi:hypothetical protein